MAYCTFLKRMITKQFHTNMMNFLVIMLIKKTAPFDFDTFNIYCPNLGILEQLKTLLNKLASYSFRTIIINSTL